MEMTLDEMAGALIDGPYRYRLWRRWDAALPLLHYSCLNPSIASGTQEDPTSVRFMQRAKNLGFGGYITTNAYAWVGTDFRTLEYLAAQGQDIVGPENDKHILEVAAMCTRTICGWGPKAKLLGRHKKMLKLLAPFDTLALRVTKHGYPEHPLYLSYGLEAVQYPGGQP